MYGAGFQGQHFNLKIVIGIITYVIYYVMTCK